MIENDEVEAARTFEIVFRSYFPLKREVSRQVSFIKRQAWKEKTEEFGSSKTDPKYEKQGRIHGIRCTETPVQEQA